MSPDRPVVMLKPQSAQQPLDVSQLDLSDAPPFVRERLANASWSMTSTVSFSMESSSEDDGASKKPNEQGSLVTASHPPHDSPRLTAAHVGPGGSMPNLSDADISALLCRYFSFGSGSGAAASEAKKQ